MRKSVFGKLLLTTVLAAGVSACGGGGGSTTSRPPAGPETPPPPPPPPPPAETEYDKNTGLAQINASAAYSKTAGAGVVIGMIDTGIDFSNAEFAGRIDSRSTDAVEPVPAGNLFMDRGTDATKGDVAGHGTAVASVLAAAKNDKGTHGVAYEATLLSYRADDGKGMNVFAAIEHALDLAAATAGSSAPVKVINISIGSNNDVMRTKVADNIAGTAAADIVTVFAAGNNGAADPDPMALVALDPEAAGTVMIVGAVDANNKIASFSNRAGAGAEWYLVAPGVGIDVAKLGASAGTTEEMNGTSFAAPHVSGAVALLRATWPSLTASEAVQIVLDTATDLGAAGVDNIYGHGLLNVEEMMKAQGTPTAFSMSGANLGSLADASASLPAAMGDALGGATVGFYDRYHRDYTMNLDSRIRRSMTLTSLPANEGKIFGFASGNENMGMFGFARREEADETISGQPAVSGGFKFWSNTGGVDFAAAGGLSGSVGLGFSERSPLVGKDPSGMDLPGFDRPGQSVSVGLPGGLSFGVARTEMDDLQLARCDQCSRVMPKASSTAVVARYRFGGIVGSAGVISEKGTTLGAYSDGALKIGDKATTVFGRFDAETSAAGWNLHGHGLVATTAVGGDHGRLFGDIGNLVSTSWGLEIVNGGFSFGVAQPLRVERGRAGWAATDGVVNLAPTGREIALSAGWSWKVDELSIEAALVGRKDAGHVSGQGDFGGMAKASLRF